MNKSAHCASLFGRVAIIKYTYLDRQINKLLDNIFNRYSFMVFVQLVVIINLTKKDTLHSHIRLNDKRVLKPGFFNSPLYRVKRQVMHDIYGAGVQMRRQLIIHFFLALSMKSAKCYRRVRSAEKPERAASERIPKPYKTKGKVKDIEVPELPVCQSFEKFLNTHFEVCKNTVGQRH